MIRQFSHERIQIFVSSLSEGREIRVFHERVQIFVSCLSEGREIRLFYFICYFICLVGCGITKL